MLDLFNRVTWRIRLFPFVSIHSYSYQTCGLFLQSHFWTIATLVSISKLMFYPVVWLRHRIMVNIYFNKAHCISPPAEKPVLCLCMYINWKEATNKWLLRKKRCFVWMFGSEYHRHLKEKCKALLRYFTSVRHTSNVDIWEKREKCLWADMSIHLLTVLTPGVL